MHLRIFEPNEVLLEAGHMPTKVFLLISGRIQVLQKASDA